MRRLVLAATLGLTVLVSLPGRVLACTGPVCRPPDTGVEGPQAVLFVIILFAFGTIMAFGASRN